MSRFKIQYVSNLFIDIAGMPAKLKPVAPNLALVGNICMPKHYQFDNFIKYVANNWENVYYIPSYHELYDYNENYNVVSNSQMTLESIYQYLMYKTNTYKNVSVLWGGATRTDSLTGTVICGATGWFPTKHLSQNLQIPGMYIEDNKTGNIRSINLGDIHDFHERDMSKIKAVSDTCNNSLYVLTYHPVGAIKCTSRICGFVPINTYGPGTDIVHVKNPMYHDDICWNRTAKKHESGLYINDDYDMSKTI